MINPAYGVVFNQLVLPSISAVLVVTIAVAAFYRLFARLPLSAVLGFSIPFGFLGGISGLIAGATSEPIVGAFLTGLLGLVSGALSLLFARQAALGSPMPASSDITDMVGPAIVVLCLTALAGLAIGRVYQTQWVNYERQYAEVKDLNEKVNMPLAKLWKQHEYCLTKARDPGACDAILTKIE
jgi:hypothetical protein